MSANGESKIRRGISIASHVSGGVTELSSTMSLPLFISVRQILVESRYFSKAEQSGLSYKVEIRKSFKQCGL